MLKKQQTEKHNMSSYCLYGVSQVFKDTAVQFDDVKTKFLTKTSTVALLLGAVFMFAHIQFQGSHEPQDQLEHNTAAHVYMPSEVAVYRPWMWATSKAESYLCSYFKCCST